MVVPDAREVLLDRHAHARVEIPPELGPEHAGQVMAAAPLRGAGRWNVAARAVGEGAGQPRPEPAIGRPGPLSSVGIDVLPRALSQVVALGHVAAEAVAHEDGMLALRAAGDEPASGHHDRVAVHVVDVRVHRVLEGDLPIAPPVDLADEDEGLLVEELLRHVLLDGGGRALPDPHEHQALQRAGGIGLRLGAGLAAHAGIRALREHHHVLARLVVHPAVIRARDRPPVVAVALAEPRAPMRADVLDGHHVAAGAAEQAEILAQERDLHRLPPPDLARLDRRVPVVAQTERRDQVADVAAEPRHAAARARVGHVQARGRLGGRCRHAGLLGLRA